MKYYRRMLYTFVSISIAYTIAIAAILLVSNHISIVSERESDFESSSQSIGEFTTTRLQSVLELEQLIGSLAYAKEFVTESPSKTAQYARLQLFEALAFNMASSTSQKTNIALSKLTDDYSILYNATGNVDFMLRQLYLTAADITQMEAAFEDDPNLPFYFTQHTDNDGDPLYTFVTQIYLYSEVPLYLFVTYNQEQLFGDLPENTHFSIFLDQECITSTSTLSEEDIVQLTSDNDDFMQKQIATNISGVYYVYAMKEDAAISSFTWKIIGINILALMISLISMHLLTQSLYRPIKQTLFFTTETSDSVSNDEFVNISETFSKLNFNLDKLSHTLHEYEGYVDHQFYYELLNESITDTEFETAKEYMDTIQFDSYVVALIQFTELTEPTNAASQKILYETRKAFLEYVAVNKYIFKTINLNLTSIALIYTGKNLTVFTEYLRNTILQIEPAYGVEISAYVGTACTDLRSIGNSFLQAKALCENSSFHAEKSKVSVADVNLFDEVAIKNIFYPLSMEQSIISSVVHGKSNVWKADIKKVVLINKENRNIEKLAIMLASTLRRIIDGLPNTVVLESIHVNNLENCTTYQELETQTLALLDCLTALFVEKNLEASQSLKVNMFHFIEHNFAEDISLFDLADNLNVSKNYASTLFKKATGQNFKDYLAEFRFQKACEILQENPTIKIKQVSSMVGCNPEILHRLFIRYTQCSPSEYQKQYNRQMKDS